MRSRWDETHEKSKEIGTGSQEPPKEYKEINYPFGKYEITVRLTQNNEFIGISEVRINKDFLTYEQKTTTKGFHDVEEFYRE